MHTVRHAFSALPSKNTLEKREEHRTHDELGDTTSEVTPATHKGVGSADDLLGEHTARPVLAHDEGTSGNTNEQTKDGKASGTVDETSERRRDGRSAEDDGEEDAGSELVAGGSEEETHEDGSGDADNRRSPDLLLGQVEGRPDLREKRSDGEPDEEGDEETPPRAVEGTHVWAGEVAQLDLAGLVILVGVDLQGVSLILFHLLRL